MDVNVKIVKSHSEKELVLSIRKDVFIRGLNIPEYLEIDKICNEFNIPISAAALQFSYAPEVVSTLIL